MTKKRILFFAEAVTLAHVGRCISIANALHETGDYDIALAADNRYNHVLGELPYPQLPLLSVTSAYFMGQLAKGAPLYASKQLSDYVENDLKLIEEFKPDFIFGDFRISLAISARMKKIPYATITNPYWSPYAQLHYPIPEIPLTKLYGVKIAETLFNVVKPIVFFIHSMAFNKTCKKFGQPPLANDMRHVYTDADYTLYADVESLFPMKPLPAHHHFIGPVLWSADTELPSWWDNVPTDKPIVFITLGSSGNTQVLPQLLDALSDLPVTVICVTANRTNLEETHPNIYSAPFIPAEAAVQKADLVICNGGSPMVYQALAEKTRVLSVPSNLDQYLMASIVAHLYPYVRSGKAHKADWSDVVMPLIKQPVASLGVPNLDIDRIVKIIDNA